MNRNIDKSWVARSASAAVICAEIVFAAALGGCGESPAPVSDNAAGRGRSSAFAVENERSGEDARPYRVRVDVQRGRYWVLEHDSLSIYRTSDNRLAQKIVLPGWNVAAFLNAPDMVLDRAGRAFISSNTTPMLWRVDPDTFKVTRIDITLQTRESRDIGFSGLAFAADGTLFGVTALAASLWRIRPDEAKATPIELSTPVAILDARALWVSYDAIPGGSPVKPILCVATSAGPRRIELSPDLSKGRVSGESCDREPNVTLPYAAS